MNGINLKTRLRVTEFILKNDYDSIMTEMANHSGLFNLDQEWFSKNINFLKEKIEKHPDKDKIKSNYNL